MNYQPPPLSAQLAYLSAHLPELEGTSRESWREGLDEVVVLRYQNLISQFSCGGGGGRVKLENVLNKKPKSTLNQLCWLTTLKG